jgi:predicted GNAT family N-acyltransferase
MTHELECEVQSGLSPSQVDDLLRLYANEWWTKGRTRPDVERMLEGTDLLFAVTEKRSESLVAFARVITDRTYVALVLDVIVAPAYRDRGLGRLLVERICSGPELRNVERIELTCQPEHVPFYRKWGFTENVGRSQLMRRTSNPLFADANARQAHRAHVSPPLEGAGE